nr:WD40 repeat domain-containing protein [Dactylosporangium sucinum]
MTTTILDGQPVAVTASHDNTIRVWDLTSGTETGAPRTKQQRWVRAVVATTVNGRSVAVTGGWQGTVHLRDLAANGDVGTPATGRHGKPIQRLAATTTGNGQPVAITSSGNGTTEPLTVASRSVPTGSRRCRAVTELTEVSAVGGGCPRRSVEGCTVIGSSAHRPVSDPRHAA